MANGHSIEDPNWDLLPAQPKLFFGLPGVFERVELKRSYNRWIRRYKPERCPDEFQRIRAAYEHLDEALRYGMLGETQFADIPNIASLGKPEAAGTDFQVREAVPQPFPTALRLEDTDPRLVLRALTDYEHKSPANWIHLALLADELTPDDPMLFYKTLVQGVLQTGGAVEVVGFLSESCHADLKPSVAGKLVLLLQDLVAGSGRDSGFHASWYFFATEHLWLDLIEHVSFEKFQRLFERACKGVDESGYSAYLVLLFHLVRHGSYKADPAWMEASHTELGESYHQLPPWLQAEMDVFEWLDSYRHVQPEFVAGHPARGPVDRALKLIAMGDEVRADRAYLEALAHALDNRDELLDAYALDDEVEPALTMMGWYADVIAQRGIGSDQHPRPAHADRDLREFLYGIERMTDRSLLGKALHLLYWVKLLVLIFMVVIPFGSLFKLAPPGQSPWIFWPSLALGLAFLFCAYQKGWIGSLLGHITEHAEKRLYQKKWRSAIAEFLGATHMPFDDLLRDLPESSGSGISYNDELFYYLRQDPGLAFYALALRFAE